MPDWNDDFSAYFDAAGTWATPAAYCMAFAAMNERLLAIGGAPLDVFAFAGTPGTTGGVNRLPQIGDDLQAASGLGDASAIIGDPIVSHRYGLAPVQSFIEGAATSFVATIDAAGAAVSLDAFDGAPDGPDAGTDFDGGPAELWTFAKLLTRVLGGQAGWTRKYPKEYADDAATTYAFPNTDAFAEGDVARNLATRQITLRSGGAWVAAPAGSRPDVVTAYGRHVAGDYIGPWLFNEVRDCLNALTVVVSPCLLIARPYEPSSHGGRYSGGDMDFAKAQAEDGWASDQLFDVIPGVSGLEGGWGYDCQMSASTDGSAVLFAYSIVVSDQASLFALRRRAMAQRVGPPDLAKEVRFYFYPVAFGGNYADNGTGYTEDRWNRFDTVAANTDAVVRSDWINPDIKTQPAWADDNSSKGWQARTDGSPCVMALYDYGVGGGFRYTATSTGTCADLDTLEVIADDCDKHFCLAKWRFTYNCWTGETTNADTGDRECSTAVTDIGWVRQADETGTYGEPVLVWERKVVTGQMCDGTDASPCTRAAIGDDGDGDPSNNTDPDASPPGPGLPAETCGTCPTDQSACCDLMGVVYTRDGVRRRARIVRTGTAWTSDDDTLSLVCFNGAWKIVANGGASGGTRAFVSPADDDESGCPPTSADGSAYAPLQAATDVVIERVICLDCAACDCATYAATGTVGGVTVSRSCTATGQCQWPHDGGTTITQWGNETVVHLVDDDGNSADLVYTGTTLTGCPDLPDGSDVTTVEGTPTSPTGNAMTGVVCGPGCPRTLTVIISDPAGPPTCDDGQSITLVYDVTNDAWLSSSTNSYLFWDGSQWVLHLDITDMPGCDLVVGCGSSDWAAADASGDHSCPPLDAVAYTLITTQCEQTTQTPSIGILEGS